MPRAEIPRVAFGAVFIVAGVLHFVFPGYYRAVMPSYLPAPGVLVAVSGVAEIAGGVGFVVRRWRSVAGLGLVVLLLAVLPANVEMLRQARASGVSRPVELALWLRLPFQAVLMWWAWRLSRRAPQRRTPSPSMESSSCT